MKTLKELSSAMEVGYDVVWRAKQRLQEAGMWGDTEKDAMMGGQAVLVTSEQEGLLRQEIENEGMPQRIRGGTTQMSGAGTTQKTSSYHKPDDKCIGSTSQTDSIPPQTPTHGADMEDELQAEDFPRDNSLALFTAHDVMFDIVKRYYKDKFKRHALEMGLMDLELRHNVEVFSRVLATPGLRDKDRRALEVCLRVIFERFPTAVYKPNDYCGVFERVAEARAALPVSRALAVLQAAPSKTIEQLAKEEGWLF